MRTNKQDLTRGDVMGTMMHMTALIGRIIVGLFLPLLFNTSLVMGSGFNDRYSVRVGNLIGDSTNEIYIKAPSTIVIPVDDIPVVISPAVREFILQSDGQSGFTIVHELSPAQKAAALALPRSTLIDLFSRDVDLDGRVDLDLVGIDTAVPGHFDQIVYAPPVHGRVPSSLTAKTAKFSRFHEHLFGWMKNNNYFDQNAPRKITSVEPAQRVWFGSISDRNNVYLMNRWLSECSARNPSYFCALSDRSPPPPCIRTVPHYDEAGNYIGTGTADICQSPIHVIVYAPGAIVTSPDYSVFDSHARETADILDRINRNCPVVLPEDEARLLEITEMIYQHFILREIPAADKMNSFAHEPFPGDELFNPSDKTYHHYDVLTLVCDVSEANCNMTTVRDNAGRRFSYPAFMLREHLTQIPGPTVTAYVTQPGFESWPLAYIIPAGPVSQRVIGSGRWLGGRQNVTHSDHLSYPGTISRYIEQRDNGLYVFTHGIGINRAGVSASQCLLQRSTPYNIFLGAQNDTSGPKAFKQLDKQMIKYWQRNFSPAGAGPDPVWSGVGNAASIPAPNY